MMCTLELSVCFHQHSSLLPPFAAVQSLNSLNDQIAQFMVTRPCSPTDEDEAFIPGEGGTLRKSMTLMRHLLVDAQVPPAAQWSFVPLLRLKCSGGEKLC